VIEAFRQLGVDKENAVYVGDSDVDLQTACNSGLPCISVLWGFRSRAFLEAHGATTFASKPEEILHY
jgi:phosphoglycolate phosphatase